MYLMDETGWSEINLQCKIPGATDKEGRRVSMVQWKEISEGEIIWIYRTIAGYGCHRKRVARCETDEPRPNGATNQ